MTALHTLNLLTTFGAFSAVCWRLYQTPAPGCTLRCRTQWFAWGAVHVGLAYSLMVALFENLSAAGDQPVRLHYLLFKVCLMVLFLTDWRRRAADRC